MRAGGLRKHRIEIQAYTEVRNEFGERVKAWTTVITTNADATYKDGVALLENREAFTEYRIDFFIRQYHDVNDTMRVIFAGSKYKIEAVLPNPDKQLITLKTRKINE